MKTEIYVRHREHCTNKGIRSKFDGCPVYARYRVRDLHTGNILEEFHGSLRGITGETAATEYVENRFILLRNHVVQPATKSKTVEQAKDSYIKAKRRELAPVPFGEVSPSVVRLYSRLNRDVPTEEEHEMVKKLERLLGRFVNFCLEHKPPIKYIVDVRLE